LREKVLSGRTAFLLAARGSWWLRGKRYAVTGFTVREGKIVESPSLSTPRHRLLDPTILEDRGSALAASRQRRLTAPSGEVVHPPILGRPLRPSCEAARGRADGACATRSWGDRRAGSGGAATDASNLLSAPDAGTVMFRLGAEESAREIPSDPCRHSTSRWCGAQEAADRPGRWRHATINRKSKLNTPRADSLPD
jgi:hypothetical protein